MADQDQSVIAEFLAMFKRNPSALSSVFQMAQAANTSKSQVDLLELSERRSSSLNSSTSEEDSPQHGSGIDAVSSSYSAEDLLTKRGRDGKGSKAQQTFWVRMPCQLSTSLNSGLGRSYIHILPCTVLIAVLTFISL